MRFFVVPLLVVLVGCSDPVPEFSKDEFKPGGQATLKRVNTRTFIHPSGNLSIDDELGFWNGLSFFKDPWVAAPAATTDRDGLGPLYNSRSCKACHSRGGRGKLVGEGVHSPMALLMRLGDKHDGLWQDPIYGGQLQSFSLAQFNQLKPEAKVEVSHQKITGTFADGTPYELIKPSYKLRDLAYGVLHDKTQLSPRYAPAIYGMGLLDAINSKDLLKQQDINDENSDGISAKYNWVPDVESGDVALGRFGFKALQPTLKQQVAAAFVNDIGITNPLFKQDTCTELQPTCIQAAVQSGHTNELEIMQQMHGDTEFFSAHVAVQPTRKLKSKKAQAGRRQFYLAGCQHCHTPSYTTAFDYPDKNLAGQKIWPYTNLALHDMGPALADGKAEYLATSSEWRTPPLWGIGLQQRIQGYQAFLHDGRARTLAEAILWHGGEAEAAQKAFINMTKQEREALIYFLQQI